MVDTVLKWASTSKRLNAEADGAERKLVFMINKEQEGARDYQTLEKARNDHRAFIIKQVFWFRSALDQIQVKLDERVGYNERQARAALQNMLENFESRLASFKLTMRGEFDRLENDETQLNKELEPILANLEQYSLPSGLDLPEDREPVLQSQAEARQKALLRLNEDMAQKASIGEVDRELASLGRYGDWDPRDHDAFVRVWNSILASAAVVHRVIQHDNGDNVESNTPRTPNRGKMDEDLDEEDGDVPETSEPVSPERSLHVAYEVQLNAAQRAQLLKKMEYHVLGKSKEELVEHLEWYCKVLALNAKKKKLLADWRHSQAQRRKSLLEKVEKEEEEELHHPGGVELDEEALAKEEARLRKQEEQRITAQQRAAKWRADKKAAEEKERVDKQMQWQREQKEAADERKKRQNVLQTQIAVWKEAKHKDKSELENSSPRKTDPAELRRRQERDLELARQRKEKAALQAKKKTERDIKLLEALQRTPEPTVERDPTRLLAATKASEANKVFGEDLDAADHRRATSGAHSRPIAMTGRDLQFAGRAKPNWMRPPH